MSKKKLFGLKKHDVQALTKLHEVADTIPVTKKIMIDPNSIFMLFHKGHYTREWFVWRDHDTCKKLTAIKGSQPAPKGTLLGATPEQIAFARANSLLQKLEMHGPHLEDHWDKTITLDNIHGRLTRKDRLVAKSEYRDYRETAEQYNQTIGRKKDDIIPCVSPGYYHTHFSDGKNSRVMMWVAFPDTKIIVIVDLGHHENFKYHRRIDPIPMMFQAMKDALDQGFYGQGVTKDKLSGATIELEDESYSGPASSNGRII